MFVCSSVVEAEDPYGSITIDELKNGLKVIFSPTGSPKEVTVELRVLSGWNVERNDRPGIALLVKHAVFRDSRGQSQIKRVGELGGKASAEITPHYTLFRISVPPLKGTWAINELSRILVSSPSLFGESRVENSRAETLRELGRGGGLKDLFWSWLGDRWQGPDLLESEFGVSEGAGSPEVLRRSLSSRTPGDANDFYRRFYTPSNAVLFLSGPFKKAETLLFVKETFEAIVDPDREPDEVEAPRPTPRDRAYVRSRLGNGETRVDFGTKFWDISPEDEMVLRAYFDYSAERLNQILGIDKAGENHAEAVVWVDSLRFGYAYVGASVPRATFATARAEAVDWIRRPLAQNGFDETQARRAIDTFLEKIARSPGAGDRLFYFQSMYQTRATPYEVLEDLRPADFVARLTKLLDPDRGYLVLKEPPIFIDEEIWILYLATSVWLLLATRFLLKRKFEHTEVRYVRRIRYSPLVNGCLAAGYFALTLFLAEILFVTNRWLLFWNGFQSNFVINTYLRNTVWLTLFFSLSVSLLCLLPRKLMICGDTLILKSLTYAARRHAVDTITEVYVCRPWTLFSRRLWTKGLWVLHWTPWRKGILIRFENGTAYYLGFRRAEKVAAELHVVLGNRVTGGSAEARNETSIPRKNDSGSIR